MAYDFMAEIFGNDPFGQTTPAQTTPPKTPGVAPTSGGGAGNPFTDMLNHVQGFNDVLSSGRNRAVAPPPQPAPKPYTPPAYQTVQKNLPPPTMPPPQGGGGYGGPPKPPAQGGGAQMPQPPSAPAPPSVPPKPDNAPYSDWAWQKANEWGATPGYEYLKENPSIVQSYGIFVREHPDAQNVDIVDWLKGMGMPSPNAGRRGYDTYTTNADGTPTSWFAQQQASSTGNPNNPIYGPNPNMRAPGGQNLPGYWGYNPNLDQFGNPIKQPTPAAPTAPTTQTPTAAPPAGTPTPPPAIGPTGTATPPPTTPAASTPTATTPPATTPTQTPTADVQSLIDTFNKNFKQNQPDIESMLDPMFARQRQKLQQDLEAQAALTPGRLQSGGFGQNEAQAMADLSGQQSATLAGALQQQSLAQMQQNTALMQLGTQAGMQKYVADLNADLTKFQVNTNADLQRWLDSSDNALKKYGIDVNDVLARYQSDLQLKGQMYAADKSVNSASLYAAASGAAANAAAAASRANAQLQFQLGTAGLNVQRENNIGNFILGLLNQGSVDLNTINAIISGTPLGSVVVKNP